MRNNPSLKSSFAAAAVLLLVVCSLTAMQTPAPLPDEPAAPEFTLQLDEFAKPQAETLSYIVQAGKVLIFNLPEFLGGRRIQEYKIKSAPALSWLVKRSFFWRTLAKDVGEHEVLLNAMVNGTAVESVVIEVEIR